MEFGTPRSRLSNSAVSATTSRVPSGRSGRQNFPIASHSDSKPDDEAAPHTEAAAPRLRRSGRFRRRLVSLLGRLLGQLPPRQPHGTRLLLVLLPGQALRAEGRGGGLQPGSAQAVPTSRPPAAPHPAGRAS